MKNHSEDKAKRILAIYTRLRQGKTVYKAAMSETYGERSRETSQIFSAFCRICAWRWGVFRRLYLISGEEVICFRQNKVKSRKKDDLSVLGYRQGRITI